MALNFDVEIQSRAKGGSRNEIARDIEEFLHSGQYCAEITTSVAYGNVLSKYQTAYRVARAYPVKIARRGERVYLLKK